MEQRQKIPECRSIVAEQFQRKTSVCNEVGWRIGTIGELMVGLFTSNYRGKEAVHKSGGTHLQVSLSSVQWE